MIKFDDEMLHLAHGIISSYAMAVHLINAAIGITMEIF